MANNLVHAMNNVSLADEEEGGIEINEEILEPNSLLNQTFNANLCVVGRFITEGKVDFEAMQHTLAILWKPGKGVYMKELDSNLYIFQFYHEIDVKRVIEGCPWSFNRRALVMSRLKEGQNPRCVDLNYMDLWVQVPDLKVGFMSETILKGVGNYVGKYIQSCPSNFTGVWRDYMRIRVSIDLSKPLKRRMKLKMTGETWFWINFKYENVPSFCFICGIVGHSERFCSQLFEKPENEIVKPYGAWMRAPLRRQVKPIGAKWLRNGEGGSNFAADSQSQEDRNGDDGTNQDPTFPPKNPVSVEKGGNQGDMTFQNSKDSANISPTNSANSTDVITRKTAGVIEIKKRRTDNGLGSEEMGFQREVYMDFDDVSETTLTKENPGNNAIPKNDYGAGTHESTRLSL